MANSRPWLDVVCRRWGNPGWSAGEGLADVPPGAATRCTGYGSGNETIVELLETRAALVTVPTELSAGLSAVQNEGVSLAV